MNDNEQIHDVDAEKESGEYAQKVADQAVPTMTVLETPEVPVETAVDESPDAQPVPSILGEMQERLAQKKAKLFRQIAGKSKVEKSLIMIGQRTTEIGGESKVGVTRKNKSSSKKSRNQAKKSRKINRRR